MLALTFIMDTARVCNEIFFPFSISEEESGVLNNSMDRLPAKIHYRVQRGVTRYSKPLCPQSVLSHALGDANNDSVTGRKASVTSQ